MKNYGLIIFLMLALVACETQSVTPTNQPVQSSMRPEITSTNSEMKPPDLGDTSTPITFISPSVTTSPTLQLISTPTPTPTPAFQIELSQFDFDVKPPIIVNHTPPLIARSDELTSIKFSFICAYLMQSPDLLCELNATLFVAYGEEDHFVPTSLIQEDQDGWRVLSADLPASDANGQPLRYYLQVSDPQVGLDIRYPPAGAMDLFVTDQLIPVELPSQPPTELSELVLSLPWGSGIEEVGLREREGYPAREGPIAMDVARDGRIALLDHVNERVLVYDPAQNSFAVIPLPFALKSQGDIQFGSHGQIAVFDPVGEPVERSSVNIPQLYLFTSDGRLSIAAPVFVRIPAWLTEDLQVVDLAYSKLVVPIDPFGEVNSREIQRQLQPTEYIVKYMTDSVYTARFADVEKAIAFEVHSVSPLGAITYFESTPQGYVVFFEADPLRAVWFDAQGNVLQNITLPRGDYTEINSVGRIALDANGSLYILELFENGIEVRFVQAP